MELSFICYYCNNKFSRNVYTWMKPKDVKCSACGSRQRKEDIVDAVTEDIFGYNHKSKPTTIEKIDTYHDPKNDKKIDETKKEDSDPLDWMYDGGD